jgi:hypothetical protein
MNKEQPFKQHHLTRALRAARAAGMDSVKVRLPSGVEFHIGGGEVLSQSKKSAQRGAGNAEKKKKSPVGGLANRAKPGQTGG